MTFRDEIRNAHKEANKLRNEKMLAEIMEGFDAEDQALIKDTIKNKAMSGVDSLSFWDILCTTGIRINKKYSNVQGRLNFYLESLGFVVKTPVYGDSYIDFNNKFDDIRLFFRPLFKWK